MKAFTLIAIHRLAPIRREWNLGVGAALDTSSRIQTPAGDTAAARAADSAYLILCRAACRTTLWFVGKALAGEELLLTGAEGKAASAIDTFQFFVCETHRMASFLENCAEHRSFDTKRTFTLKRPLSGEL
jgi:hypothetical protein